MEPVRLYDMGMVLDDLKSAVDQVCATDSAALSDGESIQELHRCLARMEAATTRASAAFDAGGTWQADGARSSSAWLARRCGLPSSTARRRIRLGRTLRHLSVAGAAWLAGKLGEAQVAALVRARTPATSEAMERDEGMLVGEAIRLRFDGATRRAVQVRDRECFHDLCDEPAEDYQIDHVEPWSAGGETVAANGRVACGHHNRRRHRRP